MVNNQYATLISEVEKDVEGFINVPASQNAGQITYVQFANDPELPNVLDNYYLSPASIKSVLFGIYVDSVPMNIDGYLRFVADDVDTNITFGKLTPTYIGLQHPAEFDHAIVLLPNQKLKVKFIQATATTASVTQNVHFRFVVAPASKKTIRLPSRSA